EAEPSTSVTAIVPSEGPPVGGTTVTIEGDGFTAESQVLIGGIPAGGVAWIDAQTLEAITPPGSAGASDVRVITGEESAVLEGAFTYTNGELQLALLTPSTGARCGGTWVKVVGDGFTENTEVRIGGETCELIEYVSAAEIHVRSPALISGLHDGEVIEDGQSVVLPGAFTSFNPRSGRAGTWGGPIDGAVNVSVRGKGGYGNVAGAFVYLRDSQQRVLTGYTNELGQVTLSEPWLRGPVDVTVSGNDFTAYTVSHYDAKNLTVYIRYTVPSSGSMVPGEPVADGLIRGRVVGLNKYALPVPGACQVSYVVGEDHCQPCLESVPGTCGEGYECVDLVEQGFRCLTSCETHEECPNGYVCAGVPGDEVRCVPHPGERVARCGITNKSPFTTVLQVPAGGEIVAGEEFEIPSVRLGDMAVVCFGGWRNEMGTFTPTAMGVKRHLFVLSHDLIEDLEIPLDFPLKQQVRMHI
ncbi:MAG: IPT/TIG domain-containing protein, partial [Myxococcota bacterium]|nr:IPT/TIG domain-containing protein [Myxococcota bacterium]